MLINISSSTRISILVGKVLDWLILGELEAFSYQCLSRLTEEHVKIDFAFVDGQHTFDYVFVDFFLIDKNLESCRR